MSNSHIKSRQHGLTLSQWIVLFVAFMVGVGGSFILREVFPPTSVHAGVIQTSPIYYDDSSASR